MFVVSLFSGLRVSVRVVALVDSVDVRIRLHDELHLFRFGFLATHLIRLQFSFHTSIQSSRTKTDDCMPDSSIVILIFLLSSSLTTSKGQRKAVQLDNEFTNPMAMPVHTRIAHTIEEPEVPAVGSIEVIFGC